MHHRVTNSTQITHMQVMDLQAQICRHHNTLQHTATHTLQHTHCNTHTATHCTKCNTYYISTGDGPTGANVAVTIKDLRDGSYAVTYLVTVVGRYSLAVSVEGSDVKNSPFRLRVQGVLHL